ncbi:MAG: transcription elongation factor GreA [Eubacteriales bacterium]|nr:transcription elongation factor GreA [Eubacteriales bacterium]
MAEKKNYLTAEGVKALEAELEFLKTTRRQEVSQRIKEAIALGDLSENSEYDDAKNEQAFLEGRIADLEIKLSNAEIISAGSGDKNRVGLGRKVTVKNVATGTQTEYVIVGSMEADPFSGRISNESPIGAALVNKAIGEVVEVEAPGGQKKLEILQVND